MSPNTNQQTHLIESEPSAGGITRPANDRGRVARPCVRSRELVPTSSHSREYTLPVVRELPRFPDSAPGSS
jgi:hypothetical protein